MGKMRRPAGRTKRPPLEILPIRERTLMPARDGAKLPGVVVEQRASGPLYPRRSTRLPRPQRAAMREPFNDRAAGEQHDQK